MYDEFQSIDLRRFVVTYWPGIGKNLRWDQTKTSETTVGSPYTQPQQDIQNKLISTYSPYVGQGTLGGISDIEQSALGMLRNADIWGPLTGAAKATLTGQAGAQPISGPVAENMWTKTVAEPAYKRWQEYEKPGIKEEYSGPGYWGSARAGAVTDKAQELSNWLGSERTNFMWNVDEANRQIAEAKANRALQSLATTPGALSTWTGQLLGQGAQGRELLNQITDPQVLSVLQLAMGIPMGDRLTVSEDEPSEFQRWRNWYDWNNDAMTRTGQVLQAIGSQGQNWGNWGGGNTGSGSSWYGGSTGSGSNMGSGGYYSMGYGAGGMF